MQRLSIGQRIGVQLVRAVSATVFASLAFRKRGVTVIRHEHRYGPHRDERLDHQVPVVQVAGQQAVHKGAIASAPARSNAATRDGGPSAAIVYLHGGGWIAGSKQYYPADLQFLCDAGYSVFNVEYPLAPEYPAPLMLQSVLRAVAWIRRNHPALTRVHLMGDSAGANLAAMYSVVCANPELLPPLAGEFTRADLLEPASLVSLYGLLDRETLLGENPDNVKPIVRLFLQSYGGPASLKPGKPLPGQAITPLDLDWQRHPPCFLGVGDVDFLYESSARYAKELRERELPVTHKIYPGAPHGFFNYGHSQTPVLRQDVLEFLAAHP